MRNYALLDAFADFYGDYAFDEIADRLGVTTAELAGYFEDLVEDNFDALNEEMLYEEESEDEEE
jgi:hypothetical protein